MGELGSACRLWVVRAGEVVMLVGLALGGVAVARGRP